MRALQSLFRCASVTSPAILHIQVLADWKSIACHLLMALSLKYPAPLSISDTKTELCLVEVEIKLKMKGK